MKYIAKPKLITFTGMILLISALFLAGGVLGSKKALAYSTTTPIQQSAPATNSADIFPNGSSTQPWFVVGRGSFGGPNSYAKVYVPNGASANLTIVKGNGIDCTGAGGYNLDISTNGGYPMVGYVLTAFKADESGPLSWQAVTSNQVNGPTCSNIIINIPSNIGQASTLPGHTGYRMFYFQATLANPCDTPNTCDTVKSFRLSTSAGYVGLSRNQVNDTDDTNQDTVFGIDMLDAQGRGGTNWDFAAQFAPRCNESSTYLSHHVGIFDIDYGVYDHSIYPDYGTQDTNLKAILSKDDRTDTGYSWSAMQTRFGGNTGSSGWGDFFGQNHSVYTMGPGFDVNHRNLIELKALSYRNLVQLRLPFDQFDTLPAVGNACGGSYTYSCSASGVPGTMAAGQTISVTYTLKNTSNNSANPTTWFQSDSPPEQYHRKVTVDGNVTANNFTTIPKDVPPGGTFSVTVSETVPAAGSVKDINYEMWISTKGAMTGTPCNVVLSANATPNGNIYTDCRVTQVWGLSSTATYTHTTTVFNPAPPGWWTDVPPTQWPNYPYPPGPPVVSLLSSTGPIWFYQPPPSTTTVTTILPATIIPIKIHFQGSDGSQYDFFGQTSNPSGTYSKDTYTQISAAMGNVLKPHVSYDVTLFAQTSGYIGPEQNGPYTYSQIARTSLGQCLTASVSNVCQGGSGASAEVGSPGSVSYTLLLTNNTDEVFNSGFGYQMKANFSGGISPTGPTTVGLTIQTGTSTTTGSFNVVINFNGNYSVEFDYQGTRLAGVLPPDAWDATCPPIGATGFTLPYFQSWNSDVSAGGGFASPSGTADITVRGSCGGPTDSPYVSPSVSGDANTGGIRAFAKPFTKGSRSDFGVIAMGRVTQAAGYVGFFSGDNTSGVRPVFANTTGGLGGYLNGSPPSGCIKDFFSDTQASPSNSSGTLQTDIDNCTSRCQYISGTGLNISGANFPSGKQVTLYVDGDVTISGNINLAKDFDPSNPDNIPYLAIIARGNITLTGSVTRLDGLYVAQPVSGGGKGIFATCDDFCNRQLVVNGAVIAQHVQLLRTHGTLDAPSPDPSGIGSNPAEVFNFVPSMVIGNPAFASLPGTVDGLFSLSPVF